MRLADGRGALSEESSHGPEQWFRLAEEKTVVDRWRRAGCGGSFAMTRFDTTVPTVPGTVAGVVRADGVRIGALIPVTVLTCVLPAACSGTAVTGPTPAVLGPTPATRQIEGLPASVGQTVRTTEHPEPGATRAVPSDASPADPNPAEERSPRSASSSAARPGSTRATSAFSVPPVSGLDAFGLTHGPRGFQLPIRTVAVHVVDNPNNVTLVIDPSQGKQTYQFLIHRLASMGMTITANGNNSLIFHGRGWTGAYTASADAAALTLRTGPVG